MNGIAFAASEYHLAPIQLDLRPVLKIFKAAIVDLTCACSVKMKVGIKWRERSRFSAGREVPCHQSVSQLCEENATSQASWECFALLGVSTRECTVLFLHEAFN